MEIVAKARSVRISPTKVRMVTKPVTKMKPRSALEALKLSQKKAAGVVSKVILSALANAKNNFGLNEADLIFKKIEVGPGPIMKRWRPDARGRAHPILKRTANITVVLESKSVPKAHQLEAALSREVAKANQPSTKTKRSAGLLEDGSQKKSADKKQAILRRKGKKEKGQDSNGS